MTPSPLGTGAGDPVCVTGIGVVAAHGIGGREVVRALRAGLLADGGRAAASGADDLALGDVDLAALVGGRGLRHLTRGTLALLAAARLALEDAGLADETTRDGETTGVTAGTVTATAGLVADFDRATLLEGPLATNPAVFPQTVWNGPACQVAIRHGLRGPNVTVSAGLNSGLEAVLAGARLIRRGRARVVLAGGFEEITPYFRVLFKGHGGDRVPRLSEGSAVLVLERRSAAEARGTRPLATIGDGRSGYALRAADSRERLRSLFGETAGGGGGGRAWCLGRTAATAAVGPPAPVDLYAAAGCGGGFSGVLAVALAAVDALAPELVAADDGDSRVAALVVVPAS